MYDSGYMASLKQHTGGGGVGPADLDHIYILLVSSIFNLDLLRLFVCRPRRLAQWDMQRAARTTPRMQMVLPDAWPPGGGTWRLRN